jgi:NAD(P)-dependent dehydrogenase (short-subunit alcohol dehydrogenase family)
MGGGRNPAVTAPTSTSERPLRGLAALVTGGGSGLGLACARHLLRDGAAVTIAGRSEDRLRRAAADLAAAAPEGAAVHWVACDVTDEAAVEAAVARAAEPRGALHIAVAGAGGGSGGPLLATPAEVWRYTLDLNLTGTFLTVKHAALAMERAGGGAIVAISSIAGVLTHRLMAAYCASKAALEMLIRVAADELGPLGIRANAVRPGLVPTDLAAPLVGDETVVADYRAQMPLGRLGTPDDVAAAVRWLAGPESGWVTGQCFAVDGGHTLRRGPNIDPMIERMMGPEALAGLRPGRRR